MSITKGKDLRERRRIEHSDKTLILPTFFRFWEMRPWNMVMCVLFVSVLIGLEATSALPVSGDSTALEDINFAFKSSNQALESFSSLVKRAAPLDTQPIPKIKGQAENVSTAKETATQKSIASQVDTPKKQAQDSSPVEESAKKETGTTEAVESKTQKVKLPTDDTEDNGVDSSMGDAEMPMAELKGLSYDAILRGFYVLVGIGTIVLLYIVIKLVRLRRRRATRKYRVLAQHSDDQEMFPLAADDGEDEEIYNAADHRTVK